MSASRAHRCLPPLLLLLLCVVLVACDAQESADMSKPMPEPGSVHALDANGSLQWQARLPCADCDAIETRLQLQHVHAARDYVLVEVYSAPDGDARFTEHGQWQQSDAMLLLRDEQGAQRVYGVLPDGRLQPLDRHGRVLSRRDDDFLLPVVDPTVH